MNHVMCIFYWVIATVSLIQFTSASKDEYLRQINRIKEDPAIQEFLQKHRDSLSLFALFHERLKAIFIHILRTTEGQKTVIHLWTEMEIILRDEKALNMIHTILQTSEDILTSEKGAEGAIAWGEFIKSTMTVHSLLELLVSANKFILDIFLSQNGLNAVIYMKENDKKFAENPFYDRFEKIIKEQLALIRAPVN